MSTTLLVRLKCCAPTSHAYFNNNLVDSEDKRKPPAKAVTSKRLGKARKKTPKKRAKEASIKHNDAIPRKSKMYDADPRNSLIETPDAKARKARAQAFLKYNTDLDEPISTSVKILQDIGDKPM